MAVLSTNDIKVLLPRHIAQGMIKTTRDTSVVARLANQEPMRFGKTDYLVFNDLPKAEFVEEGADKSSTSGGFTSVTAVPHKAQVTMRFNEEVQWADEEDQLDALASLADAGAQALSRALDFGVIHAINPLTGNKIGSWDEYIAASTLSVEQNTADADADFRAAAGLLINATPTVKITGAAFDPKFSWALANLMAADGAGATSQLRYPQLGFGTDVTSFMGVPVAQGDTVSGVPEAADTKVRAILGDFTNGMRWGIQKSIPVRLLTAGDPDGQGDLSRKNQIAMRLEIVYGWWVDKAKFATIKAKAQ